MIFSGLNTPDRAGFAKFVSELEDVQTYVTNQIANVKGENIIKGTVKSNAQLAYMIATGSDGSSVPASPTPAGTIASLGKNILPEGLTGTNYYEITNSDVLPTTKSFYQTGEKHYITDKGEVFIWPGYLVEEDNSSKWYVNQKKYYVGEGATASNNGDSDWVVAWTYDGSHWSDAIYPGSTLSGQIIAKAYRTGNQVSVPKYDDDEGDYVGNVSADAYRLQIDGQGEIGDLADGGAWHALYSDGIDFRMCIAQVNLSNGITSIGRMAFSGFTSLTSFTIPAGITSIGEGAFEVTGLTQITIPETCSTIGTAAFSECESLINVIISSNTIGMSAFEGCGMLSSVTLLNGVTTIGGYAFWDCENLSSVTLPDSIATIGYASFGGCDQLANVYYSGSSAQFNSIDIDSGNENLTSANIHFSS